MKHFLGKKGGILRVNINFRDTLILYIVLNEIRKVVTQEKK